MILKAFCIKTSKRVGNLIYNFDINNIGIGIEKKWQSRKEFCLTTWVDCQHSNGSENFLITIDQIIIKFYEVQKLNL